MNNTQQQECINILNFIEKKLMQQSKKSQSASKTCHLRVGTLRCSIGWLIPDKIYKKYKYIIETVHDPVAELIELNVYEECFGSRFPEKTELLNRLMYIHDHTEVEDWQKEFNLLRQDCDWPILKPHE